MTIPALTDLLTVSTDAVCKARLLTRLDDLGFPITDWEEGGVARSLVEIDAKENADFSTAQVAITRGGYLSLARGDWLTLYAYEAYQETRKAATYTEGEIELTCAAGSGPYTVLAGQLWVSDALGHRYNNTTGGTLASGGTLDVTVKAEIAGSAHNAAIGTVTTMVTPLVGVTCTNPDNGGGSWPDTTGTDEELDARLSARCAAKWATLGFSANDDWYEY
jgi:uncharacterized phage protein gp47/JayE